MLVGMGLKMKRLGKSYLMFQDVFPEFMLTVVFVIVGVDSYLAISSYPPRQLVKYPPLLQVGSMCQLMCSSPIHKVIYRSNVFV
jgi:hypothetical protein